MAHKLKNLSVFTPHKNLSCSEAGHRSLLSLARVDKNLVGIKITVLICITKQMTAFFAKLNSSTIDKS